MQILPAGEDVLLQFGLIGYGQWQTSNNSGPGVDPASPASYRVNAIGGAANVVLPARKASVGFKLSKEFSNSSTVQGYSLQIVGSISFLKTGMTTCSAQFDRGESCFPALTV